MHDVRHGPYVDTRLDLSEVIDFNKADFLIGAPPPLTCGIGVSAAFCYR
jgi:hypothetical protein